jgi:hypothetical protein
MKNDKLNLAYSVSYGNDNIIYNYNGKVVSKATHDIMMRSIKRVGKMRSIFRLL